MRIQFFKTKKKNRTMLGCEELYENFYCYYLIIFFIYGLFNQLNESMENFSKA